ncbi:MAG: RNA polymerase sigma factor [Rhodocyclaceae bacterium]|nr:RNA polymerase sigma factor [Rhodocyclaceae bacterium]
MLLRVPHLTTPHRSRILPLASRIELSDFLAGIERRAYKRAMFAVHDSESALDIVQDAMLKLAEKYGGKPAGELPLLFHRILQNTIRDFYRRQKIRSLWTTLLSSFSRDEDGEDDPLDTLQTDGGSTIATPHAKFEQTQLLALIEKEIGNLPPRQREAFIMRYWQDMNISETAAAMGCSEGSVKTHCSRATRALATALRARGIEL